MKLKVLGSSSEGNCYLLIGENQTLILEAGVHIEKIKKALDYDFSKVVGATVSHCHLDHAKSISKLNELGVDVYSSIKTFDALKISDFRCKTIEPMKKYVIGEFTIMPFDVKHDAPDTFGFIINHKEIGNLLFLTDTYYCKYKFPNMNHLLVECNYCDDIISKKSTDLAFLKNRIYKSHFSLKNCKEFLLSNDLSKVKEIVLIHLSDRNSDAELFKKSIIGITGKRTYIADETLEIELTT